MTQTILLGGLIEIKHGHAFKGEYFSEKPTKNILITPGNFEIGGGFKSAKLKYYDGPIDHSYILKPNDLVVTMTDLSKEGDTLGFAARIPKHDTNTFLHNQRIGLIKIKTDRVDEGYLYWLMRSSEYHNFIVTTASGSTVKHTSPNRIYNFKVNLPPISTQQKVANILDSIDEKIELNYQMNETLEQMGQELFKHYFIDNPEAEKWPTGTFLDVANIMTGKGSVKSQMSDDSDIPLYGANGIMGTSKDYLFDEPLVITGRVGTLGAVRVVTGKSWFSDNVIIMQPKTGYFGFVYHLARSFDYVSMNRGSTQPLITQTDLKNIRISLPNIDILKKFESEYYNIFGLLQNNSKEIQTLTTLRDTLLPRLISGKIEL